MTRFVHSADWQLGMTRYFLSPEAQARFGAARIEAIRTIGSLAVAEGASFVVVCGDVFETNQVSRRVILRALDAMAVTPAVRFYLLPGNHDPLDAASVFRSSTFLNHQPPNVFVLDGPGPVVVEPGVELIGAPWPNKRPLSDLVADALRSVPAPAAEGGGAGGGAGEARAGEDGAAAGGSAGGWSVGGGGSVGDMAARVRIVAGHGAVDTFSPDAANPALIGLDHVEAVLDAGRIHFVALGDRHSTTDVGSTGRVWYSGAPEPTDYDETDPGNVLLVQVEDGEVTVEVRRVGTWRFVAERFDLSGAEDCQRIEDWLEAIGDKARTVVKLGLIGQLSLADKATLDALLDRYGDLLAALESWDRRNDLVVLPDDDDFELLGLSGFASEALGDLRHLAAGDALDTVAARDALGVLYRLGSAR